MTKAEIVAIIAANTGMTKLEVDSVLKGFFETVIEAMKRGDNIELRGFGTYKVLRRAQRVARNPKTNEEVIVPQQFIPMFKPSKDFKKEVQNSELV
jgi:DNA-binding protein HU-beta